MNVSVAVAEIVACKASISFFSGAKGSLLFSVPKGHIIPNTEDANAPPYGTSATAPSTKVLTSSV
ncbi:hypothetical protein CN422_17925 [Bacillus cereus]|nr:hypothetical protein CN422_17925 [Bacillus cereus]